MILKKVFSTLIFIRDDSPELEVNVLSGVADAGDSPGAVVSEY